MFYICLDAWMTVESGKDKDEEKLNWLVNTDNELKRNWDGIKNGARFESWLNGLVKINTIQDLRPSKSGGVGATFSNASDFEQAVRFIYQIRCNLFHGGKSPVDKNDKKLVRWSANILEKWIEWAIAKQKNDKP